MEFIYVCTETDRDILLDLGYDLMNDLSETSLWVFKNDTSILEDVGKVIGVFAYGNTLMF